MKRLDYSPLARLDLRSIAREIATDSPRRAASFLRELEIRAEQAARRPRSFRLRSDLGNGLRSAVHGNYILFFTEHDTVVRIERVVHGARDLTALTFR